MFRTIRVLLSPSRVKPALVRGGTAAQLVKQLGSMMDSKLADLRNDVANVSERLTSVEATLTDLKENVDGLKENVDGLKHVTSATYVPNSPYVFPCRDPARAVRHGDSATWSCVRANGRIYAIGCCHCALFYRTNGRHAFVNLPQSVVECGVKHVLFTRADLSNPLRTCDDFVAVRCAAFRTV